MSKGIDPLRSYDQWAASVRNFSWLHEAVSGGMDVDFMCERAGQFLFIEAKPWTKGVRIPWGQHKALLALSRQPDTRVYLVGEAKDRVHVVNVGVAPGPVYLRSERIGFYPPDRFIPSTREALADMVRAWWEDASRQTAGAQ